MENELGRRKTYAVYVITKHGMETARQFKELVPHAELFVSKRFIDIAPDGSQLLATPMGPTLRETWKKFDCHIHIISVGAVVRMIAPLLENKKVDPAVVCIDDANTFSICLLSGHVGRGNDFTYEIAQVLKNTPVVTTASDVTKTLTVDILGRSLGWVLDDKDRNVTRGCAAVVNQTRVAFIQETGEPSFWDITKELPKGVEYFTDLSKVNPKEFEILLISTDKNIQGSHPEHFENSVIYRPKSLILGLGCDKGTSLEVLEAGIFKSIKEAGLDFSSIKGIASIDLKSQEKCFLEVCKKYNWSFDTYPAVELDKVEGIENPSDTVKKYVGTHSVGEAACLLATKTNKLVLPKQKFKLIDDGLNMTVSIARFTFEKRSVVHGNS